MIVGVVVLSLAWVALSRQFDPQMIALGGGAVLLALGFQRAIVPMRGRPGVHMLRHPLRVLLFAATLLYRFVVSTLLTTWLILLGDEEGLLMALPIDVRHPVGQFLLLNSITLTPSTISLLVEENLLYIHWLQRRGGHGDWRTIKESLERRIAAIFPEGEDADR